MEHPTTIQLLRHATVLITINGKKILVDPMLSEKGQMDPIANCGNEIRIPMVDLPFSKRQLEELLSAVDAILITHLHRDHWDEVAQNLVDKNKLIICSTVDEAVIRQQGFKNIQSVSDQISWEGLRIHRTSGQHGTGEIGRKMGEVAGFIFIHEDDSIYIAGDTIWCADVEDALTKYAPEVTILNVGGAQFLTGDPITMTPADVISVHKKRPATTIIAIHMDTVNHCFATREVLQQALVAAGIGAKVLIPNDGEIIEVA